MCTKAKSENHRGFLFSDNSTAQTESFYILSFQLYTTQLHTIRQGHLEQRREKERK